jgi:glutathione-specific gamma-glutamylcyclotransferase
VPQRDGEAVLHQLWDREMMTGVYDPKWLPCQTPAGTVRALGFTLSRKSPNFTGDLPAQRYREIFAASRGRYGSTLDYARQTLQCLQQHGIHDHALHRLLHHAREPAR